MVRLPAIHLERGRLDRAVELIESVDVVKTQAWGRVLKAEAVRIGSPPATLTGGLDDLLAAHVEAVATGVRLGVDSCWVPAALSPRCPGPATRRR